MTNPDTDFAAIYDAEYYGGRGADPLVQYETEFESPSESARALELRGLVEYARSAVPLAARERWLDFGSGLGVFVQYLRSIGIDALGYDEGYAAGEARKRGVPMLDSADMPRCEETFGVVSAIEVLEHVLDPLETMQQIARLLRPGGLFLYTTGNAAPFRANLPAWSYVVPEIHLSFYEPQTMRTLFEKTGLVPLDRTRHPGLTDIIRYKIMKNLGIQRRSILDRLAPWPILTRFADHRYQISSMVLAVKPRTNEEAARSRA